MRSAETLRYVGNIAKETVGMGEFRRAKQYGISPDEFGRIPVPFALGLLKLVMPMSYLLSKRSKEMNERVKSISSGLDAGSIVLPVIIAVNGLYWEAVVMKLGYNALVQIAPDTARLFRKK